MIYRDSALMRALTMILCSCIVVFATPYLALVNKSGERTETDLSQIAKVTFSTSAITLHAKDGETLATPISDIQRIQFGARVVNTQITRSKKTPGIYFASGLIYMNLSTSTQVGFSIFNLQGKRIYTRPAMSLPSGEHSLQLPSSFGENIPQGLYFLKGRMGQEEIRLVFAL